MISRLWCTACILLLNFVVVLAQVPEWHFTWNESRSWNHVRSQKIEYVKSLARAHEPGGEPDVLDSGGTLGSGLIGGLPVYVSLTTIANRLHLLSPTIQSIISGSVVPTMIYVFISTDPHLIDTGINESDIMNEDMKLVQLLDYFHNIKFVFTENIGPHRKVLPLLKHKLDEDCVIISVDDDHIYLHHWLRDMLAYYVHSKGLAVVSTRARRIAVCSGQAPYHIAPYMHAIGTAYHTQWYEAAPHVHEMLLLPTGVGGVLYRPRFFNQSVAFNRELWGQTLRADDLTFRLATLANGVSVYTACVHGDFKDNKLITSCPALPGVGFQHIARRRLGAVSAEGRHMVAVKEAHQQGRGRVHDAHNSRDRDEYSAHEVHELHEEQTAGEPRYLRTESHADRGSDSEHRRTTSRVYNMFRGKPRHRHPRAPIPWLRQLDTALNANANGTVSGVEGSEGASQLSTTVQPEEARPMNTTHSTGHGGDRTSDGADSSNAAVKPDPVYAPVHNRSHLLVVNNLRPPAKNIDHGKQGSLSSINSKHDGNFHQWNKATEFLRRKGLFDIDEVLQKYVRSERRRCVATSLLLHYDNTTWTGSVVGAFATSLQALHESWTDGRCGIVTCYA